MFKSSSITVLLLIFQPLSAQITPDAVEFNVYSPEEQENFTPQEEQEAAAKAKQEAAAKQKAEQTEQQPAATHQSNTQSSTDTQNNDNEGYYYAPAYPYPYEGYGEDDLDDRRPWQQQRIENRTMRDRDGHRR